MNSLRPDARFPTTAVPAGTASAGAVIVVIQLALQTVQHVFARI